MGDDFMMMSTTIILIKKSCGKTWLDLNIISKSRQVLAKSACATNIIFFDEILKLTFNLKIEDLIEENNIGADMISF